MKPETHSILKPLNLEAQSIYPEIALRQLTKHLLILSICFINSMVWAQNEVPPIPIGLDAYRQWHLWPMQRHGVRAYMRSTYDRSGHNESADASHFLFVNEEDYNVTLDVKGRGILYFFRTNHWHGSPWHFVVDGRDNIVSETGTSDPINAKKRFDSANFIPRATFPRPLNWTWEVTKGGDLIWTPVPFEQALRIAYSRTCYGTGYYIYHLYNRDIKLSQNIASFELNRAVPSDVLDFLGMAGKDIAPQNIAKMTGTVALSTGKSIVAELNANAPQQIRALKLTIPMKHAEALERMRLIVTWDGFKHASIDAPLCLFFGAGALYNNKKQEFLVKGLPMNIRYDYSDSTITLACYYPMPYSKSARIELAGGSPSVNANFEVRYEPLGMPMSESSYFHATYKDIQTPEAGKDMVFLDTKGIEGIEEWSGSFVGNSFIFSHNGILTTLEGDPRFFFDDSRSPQAYGTGTEEWGGGGDYWGGLNMTLPLAGHPCGLQKKNSANDRDLINSAYRFLLADLMPFGKRAVIQFEHGGENLSTEHYESVTYWYGLPKASLVKTDEIDVGNTVSEKAHQYTSAGASPVYKVTSRYELGIDKFPAIPWGVSGFETKTTEYTPGQEVFGDETMDGRTVNAFSEFTLSIRPDNHGLLLRRTLDYGYPNQTAEVYVSTDDDAKKGKWDYVGIWYLAGSNTNIYSRPSGELDPRFLKVQKSNRQFRDDEFMIPESYTAGKSKVRLRFKVIESKQELHPGTPFPNPSVWSELDYEVFNYVRP